LTDRPAVFRPLTFRAPTRVVVGALLAGAAIGCGGRGGVSSPDAPPDLLLVTLDTFRADRAGCYGHPGGLTPSIDRALRGALLARNAYAPAPLTAVSHATLLTSREPPRHGVRENGLFPLDPSVPTLSGHLARRGFRTAAFIAAFPLESRFGFASGFAEFDEDLGSKPAGDLWYAERPAGEVTDRILAWLAARDPGERVFVWAHFFDAHQPNRPTGTYRLLPDRLDYEREIREMDAQIGRLLRGVADAGRRPVLAIVSDHGEALGDHGEASHGFLLHEEALRGLLGIAVPPGSPAGELGGLHEPIVRYADLAPTLLHALGVEPMPDVDGESILSATSGDGVYGESYYPMLHYRWSPLLSWRDERWAFVDGPSPELYDRLADPGELRNVAAERPEVVEGLRRRIAEMEEPPEDPGDARLDAETREKLLALGYVANRAASTHDPTKNPKDYLDAVNAALRGMALRSEGRPQEALPLLQRAYRAAPDIALHVFQLASCLREVGRGDAAMDYYRRATELDPRIPEAWAHWAVLRFERGNREGAFQLLDEGLRENPDSFALLMTAGDLAADVGRVDDARARYEIASRLPERRTEPWEALARLAERRGDGAEARRLRTRAEEVSREHARGDGRP
jgi:arylsulfatase A-like enzyme